MTEAATRLVRNVQWHRLASIVEEAGGIHAATSGDVRLADPADTVLARELAEGATTAKVDAWLKTLEQTAERVPDSRLVTVLDDEYPHNLRRIFNRPPFLFVRGTLLPTDERAVAVVGTRSASPEGMAFASELAAELVASRVTVVSGLAAGIDGAAHRSSLDAGGRTIAVMGTGIDRTYPAEHADLAEQIVASGALLSQFWPGAPPRGDNFPRRNIVTSGMAVGSVVIEASATSGARNQARRAVEHDKRLFLVDGLVTREKWTAAYIGKPGVSVITSASEVLPVLDRELVRTAQLAMF